MVNVGSIPTLFSNFKSFLMKTKTGQYSAIGNIKAPAYRKAGKKATRKARRRVSIYRTIPNHFGRGWED